MKEITSVKILNIFSIAFLQCYKVFLPLLKRNEKKKICD